MTNEEEFEYLCQAYAIAYPDAENPISALFIFGEKKLIEIMHEAEGRQIVFSIDDYLADAGNYSFIG